MYTNSVGTTSPIYNTNPIDAQYNQQAENIELFAGDTTPMTDEINYMQNPINSGSYYEQLANQFEVDFSKPNIFENIFGQYEVA